MKQFLRLLFFIQLLSCTHSRNNVDMVTVGGNIDIPIDGCIEAQKKIMGNSIKPKEFCMCLIPKMYIQFKNDPKKLKLLKDGKFDEVAKGNIDSVAKFYDDCISQSATNDSTSKIYISPKMAEQIKGEMKRNLIGTEISKTNDINRYCDCLINGLRTDFTAREIMQGSFNESEKYKKLGQKCLIETRLK